MKINIKFYIPLAFILISTAYADLKPINIPKIKGPDKKAEVTKIPIDAHFHFYASSYSPKIPDGSFSMKGTFDNKNRELVLKGVSWIKQPENYEVVDLKGTINPEWTAFTGKVKFEGCKEFVLKRTSKIGKSPLSGKWEGSYICAQGVTGLTLTIK